MDQSAMPVTTEAPDAELVRAAQEDATAFDALYRRYLPAVYRYCLVRLGSVPDAEDATAAIFLDALDGLSGYREQGRFAAWLFTIARRHVGADRRRSARQPVVDPDAIPEPMASPWLEEHLLLERAMAQLTDERREALALRFYGGLKVAEVAALMGKGESAVKMLLHRGLAQLRNLLEDSADG
jgi:RNA polymerase sigma-70 factor, ECF subfamily